MENSIQIITRSLIAPSGNSDSPSICHVQEPTQALNHILDSGGADEGKSSLKPTATPTAKLLLRGVKESVDASPPLKSVAEGLYYILDSSKV